MVQPLLLFHNQKNLGPVFLISQGTHRVPEQPTGRPIGVPTRFPGLNLGS